MINRIYAKMSVNQERKTSQPQLVITLASKNLN